MCRNLAAGIMAYIANHPPIGMSQDIGQTESPAKTSKPRILVVEDEPAIAGLMTFLLTREGYDVQTAFTGKAGMELAIIRKFDLILLDINLPGMNGFDLCRELKQRHISRGTPIIFVSGNAIEERRQKAFELGAADFVEKPFQADDLISRIASFTKCKPGQSNVFNEGADTDAQSLGNATQGNQ